MYNVFVTGELRDSISILLFLIELFLIEKGLKKRFFSIIEKRIVVIIGKSYIGNM